MALWNRPLVPVPKQGIQMPIGFGGGYGGDGNVPMIRPPSSGIQVHSIGSGGMGGGGMTSPGGAYSGFGNTLSRQTPLMYNPIKPQEEQGQTGKGKSFLQTYLDLAQWAVPYATSELSKRKKSLMEAETEGLIQRKNMFENAMSEGTVKTIDAGTPKGTGQKDTSVRKGRGGGGGGGRGGSSGSGGGGAWEGGGESRAKAIEAQSKANAAEMDRDQAEANRRGIPVGQLWAEQQGGGGGQTPKPTEGRAGGGIESMTYPGMKSIAQTQAEARGVPESKSAAVALAEESGGTSGTGLALNEQTTPGQGDPGINIDPGTGLMVAPTDEQLKALEDYYGGGYSETGGDGGEGGGE